MIVETMTRDEVFREIQADDDWCAQRCIGLAKKYNKEKYEECPKQIAKIVATKAA